MRLRSAKAMTDQEGAAWDLPVEIWGLVLSKLPEDDSDHHHASQVSRALRAAERAQDRRVARTLGWEDTESSFAEWGRHRTGAVALTLSSAGGWDGALDLEGGLYSLASLGSFPTLTSLVLELHLPVDYCTLASCTALTALRVVVPQLAGVEYRFDDGARAAALRNVLEAEFMLDDIGTAVLDSSRLAVQVTLTHLLEAGVEPLKQLRALDVEGVVPPRGDVYAVYHRVPQANSLPWLSRLTQLTRLQARVFSMSEGVWALPGLKALHLCGGFQSEGLSVTVHKGRLALPAAQLRSLTRTVTELVLDSCFIDGEVFALPAVEELHLLDCVKWDSHLQASCPNLRLLCVAIAGTLEDLEAPSDAGSDSGDDLHEHRLGLRVTFRPMPQLTGLVLEDKCGCEILSGTEEGLLQHVHTSPFSLPDLVDVFAAWPGARSSPSLSS